MQPHAIVTQDQWISARKALLKKEKELTHARDELNRQRRQLPWVKVEKAYVFDTPTGKQTLAELFGDRSQLIINHFMLAPGWKEGCVGCSFGADHVEGTLPHLNQRDVRYVAVSRAPLHEIEAYKKRMGWHFQWASSFESDFNYDFNVSFKPEQLAKGQVMYNYELTDASIDELPGASVFFKDANGDVFHTYSSFGRGGEELMGTYVLLDMTPKGRDENGPNHNLTDWVKRHDEYDSSGKTNGGCHDSSKAS
jgi:predicted dithiol-disulfide oxidoreductase (DUF899 family)